MNSRTLAPSDAEMNRTFSGRICRQSLQTQEESSWIQARAHLEDADVVASDVLLVRVQQDYVDALL
eukprot:370386-Hanusia_phi.AAC.1